MLGRAVREFQPAPLKGSGGVVAGLSPSIVPSTQPTIEDKLKSGRQSSQSIGGFTNLTNSSSSFVSLNGHPRPISQSRQSSQLAATSTNPLKRKSSERNGLAATLNAGSFQDPPNIGTSPENDYGSTSSRSYPPENRHATASREATDSPNVVSGVTNSSSRSTLRSTETQNLGPQFLQQPVFDFNPDDFDDDSELDLDVEYPQALPTINAFRKPLNHVCPNPLQSVQLDLPKLVASPGMAPPSSTMTWSSSPAAHKAPPLLTVTSRQPIEDKLSASSIPFEVSSDVDPRPHKRRTVPWLQRKAEQKAREGECELERNPEATPSSNSTFCFKCQKPGHTQADCPLSLAYTPLTKEDVLPWNTTASAVKARQKQKKLSKETLLSTKDMREAIHSATSNVRHEQAPIFLSEEQRNVLNLVTQKKKSVFFTGSAGTGKSVLMRAIIAELRRIHVREPDRVAVTASTGLAACNIGGVTLHSFGGIGLGKEDVPELVKKINRNQKAKTRWLRTKILIIDEISMVDGALFDKLERIACTIRKNGRPFGGIQVVITGDFFQLPPVPDNGNKQIKFAFDAATWSTSINHTIGLTEVFRQRDPVFANMLNEMRLGKISDETVKAFGRLDRPIKHEDALLATELFPTRREVEISNSSRMRALQGKSFVFNAVDGGTMKDITGRDKLLANCMAPAVLELKKGAQVMLIKNLDENLVNGSIGQVVAFMNEVTFEIYEKDKEEDEDGEDFAIDEGPHNFREARNKLKSMLNKDLVGNTAMEYPLVRFHAVDGATRDLLCQPEDWKVELPNGEVQAQRRQLPLILAWALSIHKAQGQTLERVKVDLRKVFENGQAYVALSRATSQEGLEVCGFDKKKVTAHPRVAEFYETLYNVNKAMQHPKVAPKPPICEKVNMKPKDVEKFEAKIGRSQKNVFDDDEEEAMAAYG